MFWACFDGDFGDVKRLVEVEGGVVPFVYLPENQDESEKRDEEDDEDENVDEGIMCVFSDGEMKEFDQCTNGVSITFSEDEFVTFQPIIPSTSLI